MTLYFKLSVSIDKPSSKAGRTLEDETGRDQDGTVSARPRS